MHFHCLTCVGFLESVGTTELLVILVAALVVFGPRKLPEMGHMLGRSLNEFKRASADFQRTWEDAAGSERAEGRAPTFRPGTRLGKGSDDLLDPSKVVEISIEQSNACPDE